MHAYDRGDAREWDRFYIGDGDDTPHWSGQPNPSLVTEASTLHPGRALDVGCGEGGDAIWLASHGWQVTAIDPSRVALGRAQAAARAAGVDVTWIRAGLLALPDGAGPTTSCRPTTRFCAAGTRTTPSRRCSEPSRPVARCCSSTTNWTRPTQPSTASTSPLTSCRTPSRPTSMATGMSRSSKPASAPETRCPKVRTFETSCYAPGDGKADDDHTGALTGVLAAVVVVASAEWRKQRITLTP